MVYRAAAHLIPVESSALTAVSSIICYRGNTFASVFFFRRHIVFAHLIRSAFHEGVYDII